MRATAPKDEPLQHIAIVDDDDGLRRLLRNVFEEGGYRVSEARGEAELHALFKLHDVSLVTLDLNLRREDGLAIARSIRAQSDVPIIMVTARTEDVDRIVGLELGADDYIVKPFNVREVLARVRAVLRRTGDHSARRMRHDDNCVVFGIWTLDLDARELRSDMSGLVPLTTAEFNMLRVLVKHPGRVLSRDRLLDLVGGPDATPLERSIDTVISRLRRKIERDPAKPQYIKTVRGAGYIFSSKTKP
jgi:two-component system, OmpR family, response regulator